MLDEQDLERILDNISSNKEKRQNSNLKDDLSTEETLEVYHELIDVLKKHNVTYGCAVRIVTSLNYSFLVGAAELYDNEI